MQLELTQEARMLQESISDFMRQEVPASRITRVFRDGNGFDPDLSRSAAELGWYGMLVPEEYGGSGLGPLEAAIAFEEFGRGPLPVPLFSSAVLSVLLLLEAGSPDQKARLLPVLASGEARATLAAMDSGLGWGPDLVTSTLTRNDGGFVLRGDKKFTVDADPADYLICLARFGADPSRLTLVLVDRHADGVSIERQTGLLTAVSRVRLDSVSVGEDGLLGEIGQGWQLLEQAVHRAVPLMCAFKVGACQQVLDFTLQYTRDRFAFGQAIGRFQRVQDHVVDLTNHTDAARLVTAELVADWAELRAQPASAHEAKAVASEAYYQACNYSHMVHAGPGTDLDHPLMAHTLLSRSLYGYLGEPEYHKRRMMDLRYPV